MVGSPLEFQNLSQWAGFVFGTVLALIVQGEGQAFFVLMFQVYSQREKVAYDLNPANHIDPRSLPVLILVGWAWNRKRMTKPAYFPGSWIPCTLAPLSGAVAVILLSGILGSVYIFLPGDTLKTAVDACLVIAVANLVIPIPPLALGRALFCPFQNFARHEWAMENLGAAAITVLALVEYWMKWPLLQNMILSICESMSKWILHG